MERVTWSDERLDDFTRRVDARFDRVDEELRILRGELNDFRLTMVRLGALFGGTITAGLIGVIAALLAQG
jgi:hypothetical protein